MYKKQAYNNALKADAWLPALAVSGSPTLLSWLKNSQSTRPVRLDSYVQQSLQHSCVKLQSNEFTQELPPRQLEVVATTIPIEVVLARSSSSSISFHAGSTGHGNFEGLVNTATHRLIYSCKCTFIATKLLPMLVDLNS